VIDPDDIQATVESYQWRTSTDLRTWSLRCEAVASRFFDDRDSIAIVYAAAMVARPDVDCAFLQRMLPRLLADAWGGPPLAMPARRALLSIGTAADAQASAYD
jgi:hypothetical protein